MGEYRLTRNREPETRASGLVSHVRPPDGVDIAGAYADSVVGDFDRHGAARSKDSFRCGDSNDSVFAARVDGVQDHVRQCRCERIVMTENVRQVGRRVDFHLN
jgi:hypothetical protein